MKVKIESGIPFPGASSIYPDGTTMKVGDSFVVPGRHAYQMAFDRSHSGRIFKAKVVKKGQYRVWRVK